MAGCSRNNLAAGFLQGFKSVLERCRISLAFCVRVFADVQTGWDAYKEEMIKKAACREQSGIAEGWYGFVQRSPLELAERTRVMWQDIIQFSPLKTLIEPASF